MYFKTKLVSCFGEKRETVEREEEEKKKKKRRGSSSKAPLRYGNYLEYGFCMDHMNFKALYG